MEFINRMPRFSKNLNQKAQNIIEFSIIAALIAAGILVAGPYVIRSWNAVLKTAEDSVIDSYRDPLMNRDNPVDLPSCDCADEWHDEQCGGCYPDCFAADAVKCSRIEMMQSLLPCQPEGCEEMFAPDDLARCVERFNGTDAFDITATECCSPWKLSDPLICGEDVPPPVGPCPYGTAQAERLCGEIGTQYACSDQVMPESERYPDGCHFECTQGSVPPGGGQFVKCGEATDPATGASLDPNDEKDLTEDLDYTFVEYGHCRTDDAHKCEIMCCPDWCAVPNPDRE